MKQEYKKFPFFHYGEVLTSESLNNAFGYSDEQLRLTRSYTIGYGIIEGLSYTFSNGTLTLEPGVAITPDGHLVKIENRITYKGVKPNATEGYDYDLCIENSGDTTNFPKNMEDYVIVLSVTELNTSLLLCSEISCDAKNTTKELVIDVHMRKKSDTSTCTCMIAPVDGFVRLQRIEGGLLNLILLYKRDWKLFKNNLTHIRNGLKTLCNIINPGFQTKDRALVPLKCWNLLFSDAQNLAKGLFAYEWDLIYLYIKFTYYFQHLETLADAINECIAYYNLFAQNHPLLPTNQVFGDNEVYLGLGKFSDKDIAPRYRSIFCRANNRELILQAQTLERLLKRVVALCESFIHEQYVKDSLSFCWYDPIKPLGERPIPSIYRRNEKLEKYWQSTSLLGSKALYWDNNLWSVPSNKDNERLFLEGIYRCNTQLVVNKLTEYIKEHHLDFTVRVIKLVKKTLRSERNDKHPGMNYKKILGETVACESFRQKIAEKAKDNPTVLCFNKLSGSWESYVSAAVYNKELDFPTVKNIVNAFHEVNIENYVNYLNIIPVNGKLTKWQLNETYLHMHKDNKVAAFMALKSYFEYSYDFNYDKATFMQGHPNGSEILLFSYKNKIYFDANIKK